MIKFKLGQKVILSYDYLDNVVVISGETYFKIKSYIGKVGVVEQLSSLHPNGWYGVRFEKNNVSGGYGVFWYNPIYLKCARELKLKRILG